MPNYNDYYDPREMRYLQGNAYGGGGMYRAGNRLGSLLMGGNPAVAEQAYQRGALAGASTAEKMEQARIYRNKAVAQDSLRDSLIAQGRDPAEASAISNWMLAGGNVAELGSYNNTQQIQSLRDRALAAGSGPWTSGSAQARAMNPYRIAGAIGHLGAEDITKVAGGVGYSPLDLPGEESYSVAPTGQAEIDARRAQAAHSYAGAGAENALRDERLARKGAIEAGDDIAEGGAKGRRSHNWTNLMYQDAFDSKPDSPRSFSNFKIWQDEQGLKGDWEGYGQWARQVRDSAPKSKTAAGPAPGGNVLGRIFGDFRAGMTGAPSAGTDDAAGPTGEAPRYGQGAQMEPTPASAIGTGAPINFRRGDNQPSGQASIPDLFLQSSRGGPASAPGRKVVRTGSLNGKRVVQYSDGSIEEAP